MTFGGFIKFALQIYYNYRKFFKGSSKSKNKYSCRPRVRNRESKTNLNSSCYKFNVRSESNATESKTISNPIKNSDKNEVKEPSLFKRNSTKPSDQVVLNKLQEVQPKNMRIATMGVMNANKYSSKHRFKKHKYFLNNETDRTKENFDNISGIST